MITVIKNPDSCVPMRIEDKNLRVDWFNAGEGYCGDYNPKDPDDENLLRFDVYTRQSQDDDWEMLDDASYCTLIPADTDEKKLEKALRYILRCYRKQLDGTGEVSLKRVGERLSHLYPNDF